jgi:hypothetical protein
MFHLNKQKVIFLFAICFLLSVSNVLACRCIISPNENAGEAVNLALDDSEMVFSGKVIGFEYRKGIHSEYMDSINKNSAKPVEYEMKVVKLQVKQWWKGALSTEVFLVTFETRYTDGTGGSYEGCNYNFKEGENYLIYASVRQNQLSAHSCSRTKPLNAAEADLKILGKGKEPVENNNLPNKSVDTSNKDSVKNARFWDRNLYLGFSSIS